MKRIGILATSVALLAGFLTGCSRDKESSLTEKSPIDLVNPFIGTGGHGHTFPGATAPFGMVQASPDTRILGWDACSGYHYSDSFIYGFSHTHLSGTGIPDYCDILLMPQVGEGTIVSPDPDNGVSGYGSNFSHERESASPGYYSVYLEDPKIDVELTTTERVALHRYSFDESATERSIVLDLVHRDRVIDSSVKVVGQNRIVGYRHSEAWAPEQYLFFAIEFEKPFTSVELFEKDEAVSGAEKQGHALKAMIELDASSGEDVLVKVALSPVSIEGALLNLETEMPDWDFEKSHQSARAKWSSILDRIQVAGTDEDELAVFYTALYHSYICPNLFSDVDGSYRGRDGKIHKADHPYYTVFSLWDTFRALHPLMTIMEPEATEDWVNNFLLMYEQGGLLPVWDLAGNETFCMNGYHSVSVIADAYAKGITGFDAKLALEAMQASANQTHFGLNGYNTVGYVARDHGREGVSRTLEYTYDDWCIALFAEMNGEADVAETFYRRSQNYRNLFSAEDMFFRARENGGWHEPFDVNEINFNFTEGNAWHYRFAVPHDVSGLMEIFGGDTALKAALDELFNADSDLAGRHQPDVSGLIGQYAHGNEPSHHVAYLYNYVGAPYETQRRVRQALDEMYWNAPDGLSGNEDCGQMSAWYVMSSLGIYQVAPGSTQYALSSPLFDSAVIDLGNGKSFKVIANNQSGENVYIESILLNGKPLERSYLEHEEIVSGGVLEVTLSSEPNREWATAPENRPVTSVDAVEVVAAPLITAPRAFRDQVEVSMSALEDGLAIWYTLDGTEPVPGESLRYSEPLVLSKTTYLAAIAERDGIVSTRALSEVHKYNADLEIEVRTPIHSQYTAGGLKGLIDGIVGTEDFTTGRWQGYEDIDLDLVVDLGEVGSISEAEIGFLEDPESYIRYPSEVIFSISETGDGFAEVQRVSVPRTADDVKEPSVRRIQMTNATSGRYLRIQASSIGDVRAWSSTEMIKSFIFCDEVRIDWE